MPFTLFYIDNSVTRSFCFFFVSLSWLFLISSCSGAFTDAEQQAEGFSSSLSFNMDYGKWEVEDKKTFADFEQLFDKASDNKNNSIRLDNIDVWEGKNKKYDFNQGLGEVLISKESNREFSILEYYIIPIGNVYGKVALLRYILDAKEGTVKRDKEFKPQIQVYKYWYNHIVKEYDQHLSDTSYTSKNWKSVPHEAFDIMRFLMFNLTLAAIEGCEDCRNRIGRIKEDYSFVQSAEYGQNLLVCEAILRKYLD